MRRVGPLLCLLLAACDLSGVFGARSDRDTLRDNQARWQALAIRDYDFDFQRSCYCLTETLQPVRVEVRGGQVARVVNRDTQEDVTNAPSARWPTVDSLFAWTERAFDNGYQLRITYDAAFRYPTRVDGDIPVTVDDEFTNTAANLLVK